MHGSREVQEGRRRGRRGRDTFVSLIRRPLVQVLLLGTAAAQVATVNAMGVGGEATAFVRLPTVRLRPNVAVVDPAVLAAAREREVLHESEQLAKEYRKQGFSVTPELATQIGKAAAEYDIEPEVAFGLVRAESSFRNQATSRVGAVGLTQLMPRTASWMEPGVTRSELRDPETNLRVGFKYLRYLLDKYEGDEKLALLAYNRGPGTVDRALKRGRNPDNGYADFVFGEKNHGHRLFTR